MEVETEGKYRAPAYKRAAVWLAGVLLTGELSHNLSARDLRQFSFVRAIPQLAFVAVVLGALAYFAFVMPDAYTTGFAIYVAWFLVAMVVLPWSVQWGVTKALKFSEDFGSEE